LLPVGRNPGDTDQYRPYRDLRQRCPNRPGGQVRLVLSARSSPRAGLGPDAAPGVAAHPAQAGQDGLADAPRFGTGDHVVLAASEQPFTSEDDFADWRARWPVPGGVGVTPLRCIRRVPCS
jgi:hypothetical protein